MGFWQCKEFTFYSSSIKGQQQYQYQMYIIHLHSTLVLLKVSSTQISTFSLSTFTFYSSSIKGRHGVMISEATKKFTFYSSSIKGGITFLK
ncbi:hypothetical protein DW1_0597 [Proteiniborus sp. DW1]|nr:hypothetical protein DW1_0597 [Proteiniborus sp. DW1]